MKCLVGALLLVVLTLLACAGGYISRWKLLCSRFGTWDYDFVGVSELYPRLRPGDLVLFYHSNAEPPGIAGIAAVTGTALPDPTQFDKESDYYEPRATIEKPVWMMVEVKLQEKFPRVIPLEAIRALGPKLAGLHLLERGSRLSVMPVTEAHWNLLLSLQPKK